METATGADETFNLNGDLRQAAKTDVNTMDWQASPAAGVWRKRLEHFGSAEQGRVTSLVKFEAGSKFSDHDHPEGEEILVLEGTFSDQTGDYPAGSYLFNPEGFRHAPWTDEGCILFVRLRHHAGRDRPHIAVDSAELDWVARRQGVHVKMLMSDAERDEHAYLVRLEPGVEIPQHQHDSGEEIFVLDGTIQDAEGLYGSGTWARFAADGGHAPWSENGCLLFVRTGYVKNTST